MSVYLASERVRHPCFGVVEGESGTPGKVVQERRAAVPERQGRAQHRRAARGRDARRRRLGPDARAAGATRRAATSREGLVTPEAARREYGYAGGRRRRRVGETMGLLDGKVALVTGAGTGIGRESRNAAGAGGRDGRPGGRAAGPLRGRCRDRSRRQAGRPSPAPLDIARVSDVVALVAWAAEASGRSTSSSTMPGARARCSTPASLSEEEWNATSTSTSPPSSS